MSKYTIGAFFGTDLDLHLRRRGTRTVIIGGLVTNFGVETTLREAYDHGYAVVAVADAMSSFSSPEHEFALQYVFPRLGRVCSTERVLEALDQGEPFRKVP